VAVVAPNSPALVVALFAAWRAGTVPVPLNARLREYELRQVLGDCEPAAVVTIGTHGGYAFADVLGALLPELPSVRGALALDAAGAVERELPGQPGAAPVAALPEGIAAILYTSGTTGAPKGVLVTADAAAAAAGSLAELLALSSEDAAVLVIPASHAFGLGCLLASLACGGAAVLVDSAFSFKPLLEAAEDGGVSILHGSPALFARLLAAAPGGLPGIRGGFVAGAPSPRELLERLDAAGMGVLNVYGMTELGAATACRADDPAELRHTTVGRALPGYELRVSGGGDGEPGELQVRGPYVTPGYLNRPAETAEALDDGWFRTGDLATIGADGHVTIAGRAKEVVHVGGFNVFPAEVEAFLVSHPGVAEAVVVGVPDERMGEALAAFVVPRAGARVEPAEVRRFARARIAGYKLPYAVEVLEELPLLPSGKPDRAALAEAAAARAQPAGAGAGA
jgi:fatty-acyl-CoA synthase